MIERGAPGLEPKYTYFLGTKLKRHVSESKRKIEIKVERESSEKGFKEEKNRNRLLYCFARQFVGKYYRKNVACSVSILPRGGTYWISAFQKKF